MPIKVKSSSVELTDDHILSHYRYSSVVVKKDQNGTIEAMPQEKEYLLKTATKTPKLGLMLVGWAGNNGSTLTASLLANKKNLRWKTRNGIQTANFFGSVVMASTTRLGCFEDDGSEAYVPFRDLLPMVHPNDMVISGWDINKVNLAEAAERANVLEPDLLRQIHGDLSKLVPLPSAYYPDFIAANQADRADNILEGSKSEHLAKIRKDIRDFKQQNKLDKIVVVWTANTERFSEILPGVNDTAESLMEAIEQNHPEISPSTLFAVASILEEAPYINGSPQNAAVPGVVELAHLKGGFLAGNDFKSGQTKMKSVLVDFLIGAGIKPLAIASYNHLGNNDGKNLSAPSQFRSKEITKSNVVDDMVASNSILYKPGEHPDQVIVIKYIPSVGDSKRALDEYESEIFMGGRSTISIHNVCEDSLLATPLILDLVILAELMTRITFKTGTMEHFRPMHPILSLLSYMLKAPMVPEGAPVVNALFRQRTALENILRACIGLPPQNEMQLEHRLSMK